MPTELVPGFELFCVRACENGLNRGLFYWSCYDESGPGGPSFAGSEYSFQLCDWRRGGRMSGAIKLTDSGHVPAEPSPTEHKTALFSSLRRRGGQLFGAIGQTDSGHVLTEPKHVLTFVRQDAANWGWRLCWCALGLCLDKVSLCWDPCPGPHSSSCSEPPAACAAHSRNSGSASEMSPSDSASS